MQVTNIDPGGAQVKNRMDPAFDSARTAGYRDVAVSLRLVGEAARRLGLVRHVCELQLILAPVFERKVRRSGGSKQLVCALP
jgi:hypothetical protein